MQRIASKKEIFFVTIGFLVSMVHWTLCAAYFASLFLFLNQGTVGCIKGLLIVTTRGILSTAISCSLNGIVQIEKWALIFVFSFYILYAKRYYRERICVANLRIWVSLFVLYVIAASFLTSSYPVVATFKVISYAIPFCAIVLGVSNTNQRANWINYMYALLTPIILLCAATIPFGRFRIVNESFQGAINHPNLMGIFGAIYIGAALYNLEYGERSKRYLTLILLALTFFMIYISDSRTGMFSAVIIVVIHFLSLESMSRFKAVFLITAIIVFAGVFFTEHPEVFTNITEEVTRFVYKRDTDDILESRQGLMDASEAKYNAHPFIGAGFAVPYEEGVTDFQLSLSLPYEAGNILLAVLGDCGIIGSILFWGYMFYILTCTRRKKWMLFFLPIVVSLGEMAFFATNNIAIYYYVLYGICLGYDEGEQLRCY